MLKKIIAVFTVLVPVFAFSDPGRAQPASELEKKELELLVNAINDAAERQDISLIVNTMPERLYKEMAARMHTSEQKLRAGLRQSVAAQFSHIAARGYRLDGKNIHYAEAGDGIFYALVPTRIETGKNVTEFMTLALYDNTKWHLIYGGQKTVQNPVFTEIYPYTADIIVPPARIIAK